MPKNEKCVSMCTFKFQPNFDFIKKHCNSWRNWGDIEDSLQSLNGIVDYFRRNQDRFRPHAGPGHWNDPDMLVIGNFGLSYEQSKVQMALWSILAAPLFMSTDLKNMRSEYREILTNRHVIAVDQDKLGIQGKHIRSNDKIEVNLCVKFIIKLQFIMRHGDRY